MFLYVFISWSLSNPGTPIWSHSSVGSRISDGSHLAWIWMITLSTKWTAQLNPPELLPRWVAPWLGTDHCHPSVSKLLSEKDVSFNCSSHKSGFGMFLYVSCFSPPETPVTSSPLSPETSINLSKKNLHGRMSVQCTRRLVQAMQILTDFFSIKVDWHRPVPSWTSSLLADLLYLVCKKNKAPSNSFCPW